VPKGVTNHLEVLENRAAFREPVPRKRYRGLRFLLRFSGETARR
jgi:hypothetical protein